MKRLCRLLVALVFALIAEPCVSADNSSELERLASAERTEEIRPFLDSDSSAVRLAAIQKLARASDGLGKDVLIEHYQKIRRTWAERRIGLTERNEIIKALHQNDKKWTEFDSEILREELDAAREAEKYGQGNQIQGLTVHLLLQVMLNSDQLSPTDKESWFKGWEDKSLPKHVRVDLAAASARNQFVLRKIESLDKQVETTLETMKPLPVYPVPWKIYNDPQKRIEHGKTPERLEELKRAGAILRSDDAIWEEGQEQYLVDLGRPAADILVASLEDSRLPADKKDVAGLLSARILLLDINEKKGVTKEDELLLEKLTRYAGTMPDLGAFSRKTYLDGTIRMIKDKKAKFGTLR